MVLVWFTQREEALHAHRRLRITALIGRRGLGEKCRARGLGLQSPTVRAAEVAADAKPDGAALGLRQQSSEKPDKRDPSAKRSFGGWCDRQSHADSDAKSKSLGCDCTGSVPSGLRERRST